jgi:competence protein ComEC
MFRMAVPLVAGVVLARWWAIPIIPLLLVFLVATVVVLHQFLTVTVYSRRWIRGFTLLVWLLIFGALWMRVRDPSSSPHAIEHHVGEEGPWLVRVITLNRVTPTQLRADAQVEALYKEGVAGRTRGVIMLTLLRDENDQQPRVGDRMMVHAPMKRIQRIADPGGFDRQVWAAARGIQLELFATAADWMRIDHTTTWIDHFSSLRKTIGEWVSGSGLEPREQALVKALVLGQRDELDSEQRTAFARSGTIHVLAVSGMHVGLIYAVITFLFKWLGGSRRARIGRGVIIVVMLWLYAGITGGAPSILRATMMFTFIALADMTARRTDHFNSLFAAMFLMLLWDPAMTGIIGFQLSFLAVLGIILFHSPIENLWVPRNRVMRWIWSLAVLSIAAQTVTLPVSLYYFKAFPLWFLPANIIVVAAVIVSVWASLALIVFHWLPFVSDALVWVLTLLLKVVAGATGFFAGMPAAYPAVRINVTMMVFLFVLVLASVAWWQWRWQSMRWVTWSAVCALLLAWSMNAREINRSNVFTLYDESAGVLASITRGREFTVLVDPAKRQEDPFTERKIVQHRKAAGLDAPDVLHPKRLRSGELHQLNGNLTGGGLWVNDAFNVLFVDSAGTMNFPETGLLDAVIIHDMDRVPEHLLEQAAAVSKHLVLAGRTSWRTREKVAEWCVERDVPFHDVFGQGAFRIER